MKKIIEFCKVSGSSVKTFEGKRRYIATGDVIENEISSFIEVTFDNKPSRANQNVKVGDVLFAKMQDTLKVVMIDKQNVNNIYSTGFFVIEPKDNVKSKFLYWLFNSNSFNEQKDKNCKGATQKALNNEGLSKITIKKLPSLEEQEEIIKKLDKIEEIIDIRKKQTEELDELIKSQFVDMFGNPIENSKNFTIKKLGNICKIYRGASPRPINKYLNGTVPWIKIGDATKGDGIYLNNTKEKITEEGAKKSRLIKKGGLIFANCGVSLGFARIIKFDGCIHDGWLAFENYEEVLNPIFFLQSLNFCTKHFRAIAPDGIQPNLNTDIMKNYMQIVPDMKRQLEFAEFVKKTDKQKFEIQKSLEEIQKLQESLMNKYFG